MSRRSRRRGNRARGSRRAPPPRLTFVDLHGRSLLIAFIIIALVAVGSYAAFMTEPPEDMDPPPLDEAATFAVQKIDGGVVSSSGYSGRVYVLDLFATWCGPCRTQMGYLNQLRAHYSPSQVAIASIDVDTTETEGQIRQFRNEFGATWDFASDTDGLSAKYDVENIPTMVIVDQQGNVVFWEAGVTTYDTMVAHIEPLL